jgi:hypothetical protein
MKLLPLIKYAVLVSKKSIQQQLSPRFQHLLPKAIVMLQFTS